MNNLEKFTKQILANWGNDCAMADLVGITCSDSKDCNGCRKKVKQWVGEEYHENWNEVPVDTPIWVALDETSPFIKAHFARYEDGKVYAWDLGHTSWTAQNERYVSAWPVAKVED